MSDYLPDTVQLRGFRSASNAVVACIAAAAASKALSKVIQQQAMPASLVIGAIFFHLRKGHILITSPLPGPYTATFPRQLLERTFTSWLFNTIVNRAKT